MDFSSTTAHSLGHLGLIAGTLQDMGVIEAIDKQLGKVEKGLGYGHRVAAMVLNGLGFINTALYLTPRFFHDKPLDLLLGEGITPAQLNDDSLGRGLDKIAAYGTTKWYSELALLIIKKAGFLTGMCRLDSTTLSVYGAYEGVSDEVSPKPLLGYSKAHRPDLKQFTLQLVSLGKSALPIWFESLDGNSSDKKSFPETVKRVKAFYNEITDAPALSFIADSALYGEGLDELGVDWLTRVPASYGECKRLCSEENIEWQVTQDSRYQFYAYEPKKTSERWLLVQSLPGFHRENETLLKKQRRIYDEMNKALWHCACQPFSCENDAKKAVEKIIRAKKHVYDVSYEIKKAPQFNQKGRPKKGQLPDGFNYQIEITGISTNLTALRKAQKTLGRFVLATNVLDKAALSDEGMLMDYKEQGEIERGFRFIKNDTFGLDEIYLKNPERIGALMAIMTLCLLIYGLTQYRLREALTHHNEVLPNQKGKPTQTPTLMWIFTLFSAITLLNFQQNQTPRRIVLNMNPLHQKIILLLGEKTRKIYLLPDTLLLADIKLNQKNWLAWCGM